MHIVFAASECVPFAKTGGLADVVGALPIALVEMGHKVTVYLPKYKQTKLADARIALRSITVPFGDGYRFCSILDGGQQSGVQFYFIDYPQFFEREALYGTAAGDYPDNAERFALYSRAVLEGAKVLGVPDIFHCHDWQAALIPALLRTIYADDPAFRDAATMFTIHNMGYQGLFPRETLPRLMLPWELFTIDKMEFWGRVNFLKGALVFSDAITTVSRKYSQEIQTPEFGFGLEGVLKERADVLHGILNGVDYNEWNPEKDKFIARKYSVEDLEGKKECRRDLLKQFGMESAGLELPMIGIVSRFVENKGFPLIAEIAEELVRMPLAFAVLGNGDKQYEELFMRLKEALPQKFGVRIGFDNALAHKIEAGSDMFLMPSHFEPCGLNQMYSLKYGTVPIVRATGGLDDTIEPWNPTAGKGTGFKFSGYSGAALLATIHEALQSFRDKPGWKKLMINGMSKDFSWNASAREYAKIYEGMTTKRPKAA